MNSQPLQPAASSEIETWRQQSKMLGQVLRFSLNRTYLDAKASELTNHLRHIPTREGAVPTTWLRLEAVGEVGAGSDSDPLVALRVALTSSHRPANARFYYLIQSDGNSTALYLGLRGLGVSGDSVGLARSVQSFVESAWPATKLTPVHRPEAVESLLSEHLSGAGKRFAITGVPVPQARGTRTGCGVESLIDGLAGKKYSILVVADPVEPSAQENLLGSIHDLIGAVHAIQRMNVSHTGTKAETVGLSVAKGDSSSTAEQMGTSDSRRKHAMLHKAIDFVTVGSITLAPFVPAAAVVAGLSYIAGQVLPRDFSITESRSTTTTRGVSTTATDSASTTVSHSLAVGHEYISSHLQAVSTQLDKLADRAKGGKLWSVGVYVASCVDEDAIDAAAQLGAILNGPRDADEEPIRAIDMKPFWKLGASVDVLAGRRADFELVDSEGKALQHPLGSLNHGLSTPLTSDELALLCSLPRREVQGVRVRPYAAFSVNAATVDDDCIDLGRVLRGDHPTARGYGVHLRSLTKNTLVTGSVGSGKTTTVKRMIEAVGKAGVPFLIIEPAKTEYVEWAMEFNAQLASDSPDRITIYAPNSRLQGPDIGQLILNPFFAFDEARIETHIERLKTLLIGALPMQEGLPMLLESVLVALYREGGWLGTGAGTERRRWPTVSGATLSRAKDPAARALSRTLQATLPHADTLIASVVFEKGYDERVAQSFIGALRTRFAFLGEPGTWKSRVFDVAMSTPAPDLFAKRVVVNLSDLHADRPFVAGLLLTYLHEYRRKMRTCGELAHLTVLEEAHCLLEPAHAMTPATMDPKGMISAMASEMLSEMRAWGEGFVIVDQYPTRLVADAVKNTTLKIVHRLPARDDQEAMAAAMSLTDSQRRLIPFLRPGQAVVLGESDDAATRIQVPRTDGGVM